MRFDMVISDFDRTLGGKPKEFESKGATETEKDLKEERVAFVLISTNSWISFFPPFVNSCLK